MRIAGCESSTRYATVEFAGQVVLDGTSMLVFKFKDDSDTYGCRYQPAEHTEFLRASLLKNGDKVKYDLRAVYLGSTISPPEPLPLDFGDSGMS